MIYVTFNEEGYCDSVTETKNPIDLSSLPVPAFEVPERHTRYSLVDGAPVVQPLVIENPAATWDQVKAQRNEIELMPITLDDGRVFDYDKDAMDRFDRAIENFDTLPTLVNGELGWKLYDNSVAFMTKAELQAVRDELKAKQAVRAAVIFVRAEQIVAEGKTLDEIQDLSLWGI
ncbi:hypothetical protein A3765_28520 [Oleiphilus sp. HI0130]|nr:hypothetical protein A3765_28765 [Oleiphilus sp. HI0130]KZZ72497.1 hypothetical protein A3765_28520 [Oleiphilus sp. HI0130]